MIKIAHYTDPAKIKAPTIYLECDGVNILDWLNYTFESQDDLCGELACSFILNDKEIFRSDHDNVDHSILDITLSHFDNLQIVNRPAGLEPGTWLAIASLVVSVGVAVYSYMNMAKLPGDAETASESPNNKLNTAQNTFRPGEAIPECFGFGVSYPDLIQPSYYYYDDNVKKVVDMLCIGVGEYDVTEMRIGETDISGLSDTEYEIRGPYEDAFDETALHQFSSSFDGQVLIAPDDDSVISGLLTLLNPTHADGYLSFTVETEELEDLNINLTSYLYIRSESYDDESENWVDGLNGVFDIIDIVDNGTYSTITLDTTYDDAYLDDGMQGYIGVGDEEGVIGEGTEGNTLAYTGWFDIPGKEAEEIWVHVQAPSGLKRSNGKAITMNYRVEAEHIESGTIYTLDDYMTANTLTPQFKTTKLNTDTIPGFKTGEYSVRIKRLTDVISSTGSASETIKVETVASVTPYTVDNFGDTTTILVKRKATTFSADTVGKKINCDYERKLPSYIRDDDFYEEDDLVATDSFADAVAYTLIIKGGETSDTVNLAELYAIYDGLSYSELGGFTFTFDDANVSLGERIDTICNVARCVGYHDGTEWRFSRDEAKTTRTALFNRRNVQGRNAKQAVQPQRSDDANSIRVYYVDPDDNTEEKIERRFDTDTGEIINGEVYDNIIEIKLAGCKSALQAKNRADLEIRRLAYQRVTVHETTYRDALELELLDRVDWVDVNDLETFDGEILGISEDGETFDTSEGFYPDDSKSYVVFVTDYEGYPSNTVVCEARSDTEFGFVATGLSEAYTISGTQQVGSRYFITDADDFAASRFTLQKRTPNSDGTVSIELIEYRDELYEMDDDIEVVENAIFTNNQVASQADEIGFDTIAAFTIYPNGTFIKGNTGSGTPETQYWYLGGEVDDIGDKFQIKVSLTDQSSDEFGSTVDLDTWTTISDFTSIVISVVARSFLTGTAVNEYANARITIREIADTSNSVTANLSMYASIVDDVSIDSTISISSIHSLASLMVYSNGAWAGSDGSSGYYTGSAIDGIGARYEYQATNLVGTLDQGATDEWIGLDDGCTFSVNSSTATTATFDLEIRRVEDITDTTTSSITLSTNI